MAWRAPTRDSSSAGVRSMAASLPRAGVEADFLFWVGQFLSGAVRDAAPVMNTGDLGREQMELSFNAARPACAPRRPASRAVARWWFARMREAVRLATERPAPAPRPEQTALSLPVPTHRLRRAMDRTTVLPA